MWVRKSQWELQHEQEARRRKFEVFVCLLVLAACGGVYWYVGSLDNFLRLYRADAEWAVSLILLPLFIYLGYRSYVIHGSFWIDRPGKMCLSCEQGMGYSDDGWGFKVYGRRKPKWYQVRACATPEKCDIVYQFEVKWVRVEAHNNSLNPDAQKQRPG